MIFLLWLAVLLVLFLLPFLLGAVLPELRLLIAAILILSIYSFVRQFFGDGAISILLTAAAAYYLVYKHFWITTGIWWIYVIISTFIFSAVGWFVVSLGKLFRRKA